MDKKKNIILLCVLLLILIILGIIVFFSLYNNKSFNSLILGNEKQNSSFADDNQLYDSNSDNLDISESNKNINTEDVNNNAIINSENNDDYNVNNYLEDDVVTYFENMEEEVNNDNTLDNFESKFKEYFITIVDFIFYDKEIKGYTFDELTNTAKLKIIGIALKIDSKIEEKVPGYKETISTTSGRIYSNVKDKLVTLYLDISTSVCNNNPNECVKAKEIFADIKSTCKLGWDFIKGLVSSGTSKLKDWYEIYSGK